LTSDFRPGNLRVPRPDGHAPLTPSYAHARFLPYPLKKATSSGNHLGIRLISVAHCRVGDAQATGLSPRYHFWDNPWLFVGAIDLNHTGIWNKSAIPWTDTLDLLIQNPLFPIQGSSQAQKPNLKDRKNGIPIFGGCDHIVVVKITFRLAGVILLQPLMPPPFFRNIFMTCGMFFLPPIW